ncbi:MAG TPA: hypothetical protein VGH79_12255 [Gaiellaceae bacterium]|jgi:hypothetical protein
MKRLAALVGLVLLVSGCASTVRRSVLFPGAQEAHGYTSAVEAAFTAEGVHPKWVFDSRTATAADVSRVFSGKGRGLAIERQYLLTRIAERQTHPFAWLSLGSRAQVFVYRHVRDARMYVEQFRRRLAEGTAEARADGGHGPVAEVFRMGNVAVLLPGGSKDESRSVKDAIARLKATK